MTTSPLRPWLLLLGRFAAFVGLAVLGIIDLRYGMLYENPLHTLVRVAPAMAIAAIWLFPHRPGSVLLPWFALVGAAGSLGVTGLLWLLGVSASANGSWGLAETAGLLGLLYVTARWAPAWTAPWAVLGVGAAVTLLPFRSGTDNLMVVFGLLLGMAAAAVVTAGVYMRMLDSGRRRALDEVRAAQRAEFARDLHDFIAHHVTGIIVQAQGARYVAEQDPSRALVALEQIEAAGAETMASMRRMVSVLREPEAPLAPVAGAADLPPLLERFNQSSLAVARLHVDGPLEGLPVEVSTSAYRVVMEALTNVRRHAVHARVVDVSVRRASGWLFVRVADDGAPPRPAGARERGYGLVGLAERVRAVGGRITAGPGIERGWLVDVAMPLTWREAP
ncbi:sensor histidine kinase [Catellatospora tritici]|uniref:sensor histidine kinase n=1 Tax=Catellatospora tritici TaxID=2851566 RepID=UPI001C2CCAAB|nr:histidine kinase [Catellatospora tritici]MBV1852884.1 two-component sensor histidine kinase [Catellatospora tritici]